MLSPLSTKVGTGMAARGKALPRLVSAQPIVKKHLIDDQRQPVLTAQAFDCSPLLGPGEVSGGIVGVDDRDRSSAGGDAAAQSLQVKMPAMIVEKLIGDQPDVVQTGQEIKQRIARLADQHLVPRIAEQPEKETVGLAGTGGEKDLLRIHAGSMVAVIAADGLTRGAKAPRIRLVVQGFRAAKGPQNRGCIQGKAAGGWVGGGQIPEPRARCAQSSKLARPQRFLHIPLGSRRPGEPLCATVPHRLPSRLHDVIEQKQDYLISGSLCAWICKP